jgi:hypothetical protein
MLPFRSITNLYNPREYPHLLYLALQSNTIIYPYTSSLTLVVQPTNPFVAFDAFGGMIGYGHDASDFQMNCFELFKEFPIWRLPVNI